VLPLELLDPLLDLPPQLGREAGEVDRRALALNRDRSLPSRRASGACVAVLAGSPLGLGAVLVEAEV
jgi:hypothetical protein